MLESDSWSQLPSFSLVFSSLILASVVYFLFRRHSDDSSASNAIHNQSSDKPIKSVVPLPRASKLFGNIPDFIRHHDRLHDWLLDKCLEFNGQVWSYDVPGRPRSVMICRPELLEDIEKTYFDHFEKGPVQYHFLNEFLGDGIFAVDGTKWSHQRKTASNLFTTRSLRDFMAHVIQEHAKRLYQVLQTHQETKQSMDLSRVLSTFTMEAFVEIGFGVRLNYLEKGSEHPFQEAFDTVQRITASRFVRLPLVWKLERWLNMGEERQLQQAVRQLNEFSLDIIEKAMAATQTPRSTERTTDDIVSLFLKQSASNANEEMMEPKLLRDVVVNFLLAGRDTTAQTMSWFFLNLTKYPEIETKVRQELKQKLPQLFTGELQTPSMEQIHALVYLEACLRETLRLYPPVPVNMRQTTQDTILSDGTLIQRGWTVLLGSYAMARLPSVWGPDASEFKPDRWIDPTTNKLRTVSSYQFNSFHAGPRMCLGMNLAMMEMKMVVAGLVSQFHFHSMVPEDQPLTYDISISLPIKGKFLVQVQPASS